MLGSRYRIVAFAGRGGMGEVYRAEDLTLGQVVALKLLPVEAAGDKVRWARMLNEVRTARRVTHPNVCRVYDVGEADGRPFLSMEWIDGENLAQRLARKGRLPGEEGLRVARQLCAGLAAAHDRGVIHRDLKPSNVMLDERGVVRITDFGVAEAAAVVRGSRAREGTPEYMAPEQLAGQEVTAASDIYALGLVLYETFTGRPAQGTTPLAPSTVAPDLDPALDKAILRCLARDPRERPASARWIAEALPGDGSVGAALAAAQQRADRIAAFQAELAELRGAGVVPISAADLSAIERYHEGVLRDLVLHFDVDLGERGKYLSLGMRIASLVGALALAASAFYFFYSQWGAISLALQIVILVAAPLLALLATSIVAARETGRYFTLIAATLALTCLIIDVAVLGSSFGLAPSPLSALIWSGFALILAYGHRLRLLLVAGLAFLAFFVASVVHAGSGRYWATCAEQPESFLPAGALLLGGSLLAKARQPTGFVLLYRVVAVVALLAPSVVVGQVGALSHLPVEPRTAALIHQLFGFAASAGFVWLGVTRRLRDCAYMGASFFVLLLFLRFHEWWWDWMPRYLFFFIVSLTAVAALLALKRLRAATTAPGAQAP